MLRTALNRMGLPVDAAQYATDTMEMDSLEAWQDFHVDDDLEGLAKNLRMPGGMIAWFLLFIEASLQSNAFVRRRRPYFVCDGIAELACITGHQQLEPHMVFVLMGQSQKMNHHGSRHSGSSKNNNPTKDADVHVAPLVLFLLDRALNSCIAQTGQAALEVRGGRVSQPSCSQLISWNSPVELI